MNDRLINRIRAGRFLIRKDPGNYYGFGTQRQRSIILIKARELLRNYEYIQKYLLNKYQYDWEECKYVSKD